MDEPYACLHLVSVTMGTETCMRTRGEEPPEDSLPKPKSNTTLALLAGKRRYTYEWNSFFTKKCLVEDKYKMFSFQRCDPD